MRIRLELDLQVFYRNKIFVLRKGFEVTRAPCFVLVERGSRCIPLSVRTRVQQLRYMGKFLDIGAAVPAN